MIVIATIGATMTMPIAPRLPVLSVITVEPAMTRTQTSEPTINHAVDEACVAGAATTRSQGRLPADLEPDHLARTMVAVVQGGYVLAMAEQDRAPYDAACQGALELLRVAAGTTGAAPGGDGSASS